MKKVAATGCNVLLVQKSILRDAVTDLSLDFCAKMKIMVVRDVEREDVEFISRIDFGFEFSFLRDDGVYSAFYKSADSVVVCVDS